MEYSMSYSKALESSFQLCEGTAVSSALMREKWNTWCDGNGLVLCALALEHVPLRPRCHVWVWMHSCLCEVGEVRERERERGIYWHPLDVSERWWLLDQPSTVVCSSTTTNCISMSNHCILFCSYSSKVVMIVGSVLQDGSSQRQRTRERKKLWPWKNNTINWKRFDGLFISL